VSDSVTPAEIHDDVDTIQPSNFEDPDYDDREANDGGSVMVALFFLLFGGLGALYPYELARFGEQLDAIGSTTRASDVEPAGWNVALTRIVSIGMVVFGLLSGAGAL
jgi:hypothetical protein